MIRAFFLAALVPTAAAADERAIADCLAGAADPGLCIGQMAQACMEASAEGGTTAGMLDCIGAETAAWDALLNAAWREVIARAREDDATGDVLTPELTREATLRAAQRAWIAFRDADCLAQEARWGQGSLGRVSAANCLLTMTAERTMVLQSLLEER